MKKKTFNLNLTSSIWLELRISGWIWWCWKAAKPPPDRNTLGMLTSCCSWTTGPLSMCRCRGKIEKRHENLGCWCICDQCVYIYMIYTCILYIIMRLTRTYVSKYRISPKIHCFICTLLPGYLPFCWVNLGSYHYSNSNSTATSSDHCSLSLYIEFPHELMFSRVHSCHFVFCQSFLTGLMTSEMDLSTHIISYLYIYICIYIYIFLFLNKKSTKWSWVPSK